MSNTNRALVVLAAYDYESLAVTLQSLEHILDAHEKVVEVLNGKPLNVASKKNRACSKNMGR